MVKMDEAAALRARDAWLECGREYKAAAARIGVRDWRTIKNRVEWCKANGHYRETSADPAVPGRRTASPYGKARRWLVTAAQNDTALHRPFWDNLKAFAAHLDAEILVGPFTYQLGVFTDHTARDDMFAADLVPHLVHERRDLGPLVFMADMNCLPTADRPLSGLETHARGRWGLVPHAKLQLISVPAVSHGNAVQVMTTGCCTVENYTPRKAGVKARFHHVIGATLVEADTAGRLFCRQINAADDGSFQDLETIVADGRVTHGHRVEAMVWGDIHRDKLEPAVPLASWGFDLATGRIDKARAAARETVIDRLMPAYQFFHDLLDFEGRNPHAAKNDPLHRIETHFSGGEDVAAEIARAAAFLRVASRPWCRSVVVESNHDRFLDRWLDRGDYRSDPVNAELFLRLELARVESRKRGRADDIEPESRWSTFRHAMRCADADLMRDTDFVVEGGSYRICQAAGGIECGAHGHLGPNGARGTAGNLAKVAVKMTIGHLHAPEIRDGVYVAGVTAGLDHGYNIGPTAWHQAHVVTYPNGKRAILTAQDGRLWA